MKYTKHSKALARSKFSMRHIILYTEADVDAWYDSLEDCPPIPLSVQSVLGTLKMYHMVVKPTVDPDLYGQVQLRKRFCACAPCADELYVECEQKKYVPAPYMHTLRPKSVRSDRVLRGNADVFIQQRTDQLADAADVGMNAAIRVDAREDSRGFNLREDMYIIRLLGKVEKVKEPFTDWWGYSHVRGDHVLKGHMYVLDGPTTRNRFYCFGDLRPDVSKVVYFDVHFLLHVGFEMTLETPKQARQRSKKGNKKVYLLSSGDEEVIGNKRGSLFL